MPRSSPATSEAETTAHVAGEQAVQALGTFVTVAEQILVSPRVRKQRMPRARPAFP